MNRTLQFLMVSDIFVMTGFGLIMPILAIFIKDNIIGGTIFTAGLASTIYIVVKSMVQLPFSRYVDSHDDKVKWLMVGTFLIALVPFIYIFANHIIIIYFAQVIFGLGSGFAVPTWLGLWSTHLSKQHETYEWGIYSTLTGLGTASTGIVGAAIAEFIGFAYTFILVGVLSLVGCFILFGLERKKEKLEKTSIHHYYHRRKLIDTRHH